MSSVPSYSEMVRIQLFLAFVLFSAVAARTDWEPSVSEVMSRAQRTLSKAREEETEAPQDETDYTETSVEMPDDDAPVPATEQVDSTSETEAAEDTTDAPETATAAETESETEWPAGETSAPGDSTDAPETETEVPTNIEGADPEAADSSQISSDDIILPEIKLSKEHLSLYGIRESTDFGLRFLIENLREAIPNYYFEDEINDILKFVDSQSDKNLTPGQLFKALLTHLESKEAVRNIVEWAAVHALNIGFLHTDVINRDIKDLIGQIVASLNEGECRYDGLPLLLVGQICELEKEQQTTILAQLGGTAVLLDGLAKIIHDQIINDKYPIDTLVEVFQRADQMDPRLKKLFSAHFVLSETNATLKPYVLLAEVIAHDLDMVYGGGHGLTYAVRHWRRELYGEE